uniref:Gamma-interferon-inducible lysosomal thiol reductase n=1 Tax=Clastoptera arizonana TaxID=38151 RepID=A0A1B6D829_9HEMI
MITPKILKIRILFTFILLSIIWLTYHFMNNVVPPMALQQEEIVYGIHELNPNQILANEQKLVVTVFYESLCPDSKSFFVNHLLPSFLRAPNLFEIDLVPYGKASTQISSLGEYKFDCQHGTVECEGNKIHACAISKVQDIGTRLKIVTCMIDDNYNPFEVGKKCSEKFGVNWSSIEECANGVEGNLILKHYGDRTLSLKPRASFIPTIMLNKSRDNQPAILKNLWKEICHYYPQGSVPVCNQ